MFHWLHNSTLAFYTSMRHMHTTLARNALVDEPGDDAQLRQLLPSGLGPDVVRRYVSGPVHPVPGPSSGHVLQQVLHGAERQVALAVGAPVPSLPVVPHRAVGLVATAEGFLAVGTAPSCVLLPREPRSNTRPMETRDKGGRGETRFRDPLTLCTGQVAMSQGFYDNTLSIFPSHKKHHYNHKRQQFKSRKTRFVTSFK